MANPVFNNDKAFKNTYRGDASATGTLSPQPSAPSVPGFGDSSVMSYDGVLAKALGLFAFAVVAALGVGILAPFLAFPFLIGALVLMLVAVFRKGAPAPGLYIATIGLYGGAAGGISRFYEVEYNGIIMHALVATACLFAVTLAVYKSGRIRNVAKIRKFVAIALPAVIVLLIANLVMVLISGPQASVFEANLPGTNIPLGLILSLFLILLGAFMLIGDFDFVDTGVRNGLPKAYEWTAAFGLVFTTVWVYIQMLRLLSYLRGR